MGLNAFLCIKWKWRTHGCPSSCPFVCACKRDRSYCFKVLSFSLHFVFSRSSMKFHPTLTQRVSSFLSRVAAGSSGETKSARISWAAPRRVIAHARRADRQIDANISRRNLVISSSDGVRQWRTDGSAASPGAQRSARTILRDGVENNHLYSASIGYKMADEEAEASGTCWRKTPTFSK